MDIHIIFAKIAWFAFALVMIIRPLANIFPNKYILFFLRHRRFIGVVCGYSAIFHFIIYILGGDLLINYFTNYGYWSYKSLYFWGNIGFLLMLIPFFTSNNFSQRFLKQNWKKIQKLSYPAFIFTGVHVSFAKGEWSLGFVPLFVWAILLNLAEFKIKK